MTKLLRTLEEKDFQKPSMFEFIAYLLKNDIDWDNDWNLDSYDSVGEIGINIDVEYYEEITGGDVSFTLSMTDDKKLIVSDATERVCKHKGVKFEDNDHFDYK